MSVRSRDVETATALARVVVFDSSATFATVVLDSTRLRTEAPEFETVDDDR